MGQFINEQIKVFISNLLRYVRTPFLRNSVKGLSGENFKKFFSFDEFEKV